MGNYLSGSFRQPLNLDSCIQIEEVKDAKGQLVSHFIRFNLDENILDQILQARTNGQNLSISRRLLAELRSYALVDAGRCLQSGLIFCTHYDRAESRESVAENIVMQSTIALDGDIIHQIRHDCLKDSIWCLAIATAHHWLIDQLLNQLQLKIALWLNGLSWTLSLLTTAATVIANLQRLNLWTLLASVAMSWFLQVGFKRLLLLFLPLLRRWLFRQLLLRLLSSNPRHRKVAKGILERFVP